MAADTKTTESSNTRDTSSHPDRKLEFRVLEELPKPRWPSRPVKLAIIVSALLFLLGILREFLPFGLEYRAFDLLIYLGAGSLGLALCHALVTFYARESVTELNTKLIEITGELKEATTKGTEQIQLPIPYIVSYLRDSPTSLKFDYFSTKLYNRDPRLLLDLYLDQALAPGDAFKLVQMKQFVFEENTRRKAVAAAKAKADQAAAEAAETQRQQAAEAATRVASLRTGAETVVKIFNEHGLLLPSKQEEAEKAASEAVKKVLEDLAKKKPSAGEASDAD